MHTKKQYGVISFWVISLPMTVCVFVAVFSLSNVQATQPPPARPGETICPTPLEEYAPGQWLAQEKWAWNERICLGKIADLAERPGGQSKKCDVSKAEKWPRDRILRQEFVETVLLHQPFRDAFVRRGFRIRCAKFEEMLDLSQIHFPYELWFDKSFFPEGIEATDLHIDRTFSLEGSRLGGSFDADRLIVGGNLYLNEATFQEVRLLGAKIGGQLSARGSHFEGEFNADDLVVDSDLHLTGGAIFKDVDLHGAKIGGQLSARGSHFEGEFSAYSLIVDENLYLDEGATFKEVHLLGAEIGGRLDAGGSDFGGKLDADGLVVNGSLYLNEEATFKEVRLLGAEIGGRLDASSSHFGGQIRRRWPSCKRLSPLR